ncbi:MAG: putative 2OG-Fe(II) oxygenase [Gammaproteobacteria bacterium]|nr:putative 2OG-Fe(II) oxygenase [Gammaproteobacteria bacterium]
MAKRGQRRSRQTTVRKTVVAKVTRAGLGQAMNTAVELHHAGKFAKAKRIYEQVLALQPDHADAMGSLAMIEFQAKRYPRAIELLQTAIAANGNNPGYHMNLGAVFDAAGLLDDAAASYAHAIALAPTYADPYYNLGDLYLRQDRAEDAVAVFDQCMDAIGREFHALAYKAHALDDAHRHDDARYLLNFDDYVKAYPFEVPDGYPGIEAFNAALARHIKTHPTLQGNVMSTEHGKHTGELLVDPKGPMEAMEQRIHEAIVWYIKNLPDDPGHPTVRWVPRAWKLTSWGVVMFDRGHERAHIHPNGWLSGVFYLSLPDLISDPSKNHEGWLEFGRPTPDLHVQSELTLRHYQPAYGQMFLFPSYFYHGTIPFRSDQRRICVAFDVEPLS